MFSTRTQMNILCFDLPFILYTLQRPLQVYINLIIVLVTLFINRRVEVVGRLVEGQ